MGANQESRPMTFYNHIENVRSIASELTNGWTWQGAIDRAAIFDNLDAARREYMRLSDKNEKLRKLMTKMADALGIDSEWADPNWCKSNCVLEFGCWPEEERTDILCPAWAAMHELGVEVDR